MNRYSAFLVTLLLVLCLTGAEGPIVAGGAGTAGSVTPVDPASLPWGIERIQAPQAWARTTGSQDVVVAVIDAGIDTTVPQLQGKIWTNPGEIPGNGIDDDRNGYVDDVHGWDFRDDDNSSLVGSKIHWHGTFVAGIIAAQPSEDKTAGVAPGVRIMDLRLLDSKNLFYASDWKKFAEAVDYAVDNGADIINMSIYSNGRPPLILEQALKRAAKHGVIVVGIAGNDGKAQVSYPGRYSSVIAVSATDRSDRLASFSNYGTDVAVAAPGEKVTSIFPGGYAGTSSGTSFAAPHVSGTLALILSSHPGISSSQATALLQGTSIDLGSSGKDRQFGAGLVDAANAVSTAVQ
jgi:subtilisin family serine protease